jgi:AmmeMemoRadiSam system protein A
LGVEERQTLLKLARRAIEQGVADSRPHAQDEAAGLPASLLEQGACFVTLTLGGELRGCIGSLEATQSLAADVQEHALDAAINDFRFPAVSVNEVSRLRIELSVLTRPAPLEYHGRDDLLRKLRAGVDGVVLESGRRRATFLPQVWEKVSGPVEFLGLLCEKMGLPAGAWERGGMSVSTYQVECFEEPEPAQS